MKIIYIYKMTELLEFNRPLYDLISPKRFDLIAKYIYIKFKARNIKTSFYYDL